MRDTEFTNEINAKRRKRHPIRNQNARGEMPRNTRPDRRPGVFLRLGNIRGSGGPGESIGMPFYFLAKFSGNPLTQSNFF